MGTAPIFSYNSRIIYNFKPFKYIYKLKRYNFEILLKTVR